VGHPKGVDHVVEIDRKPRALVVQKDGRKTVLSAVNLALIGG
jgi:hypothetical protein